MADICEVDTHISKRYDVKKRLGKGAYGIVWKAMDKKTGSVVAVKKIFDAFRNQTDAQRTFREIMFLQHFGDHPNIIRLLDVHRADNDKDIYLVFEYMDTDLHNVIKRGNILKEVHKQYILYQLFRATKYLHSGNVIHRDQKPSNILLDADCRCKIADFGLARSLVQDVSEDGQTDNVMTDYVATRWYRAPEILLASKRYTKGVDMWSLGCILGEILLGQPLFPGTSTLNQLEKIMASIPPPSKEDIQSLSSGYASTLLEKSMMVPKQPLRTILAAAPVDAIDLLEKLLVLNPHKRLTAEQALEHPYVRAFHKPEREPALDHDVVPTLSDAIQLTVDEYRTKLYEVIAYQKRQEIRELSPFKFIRDSNTDSSSPKNSPKETSKTIPKTKSSVDSSSESRVQQSKMKYSSIPTDSSGGSSGNNRSVDIPRPPDRKLVSRHSDDVMRSREKSAKVLSTNKLSSPSAAIPRSHSGHCLVKYHQTNSSTESEPSKSSPLKTSCSASHLLATSMEQNCNISNTSCRATVSNAQPPLRSAGVPATSQTSTTASRFAGRYGKNLFSRSLDNPVITRTVTIPRATSAEKALGSTTTGVVRDNKIPRPAPTFGKRQFTSLNNVSNLTTSAGATNVGGITGTSKFVSSHGTITASALQELRQSIK
ncbi:MAPK/MAK/MRK overlapping kinase [Daphnia magna]|uniref:mitogen-activated protein kinase n=1 Tax=Daphnia magna TaxID=35525 RepID=A0A0P4XMK0_9CRUS|nr:MAPK/MAK/MRK overlapping kinase [Daphnia magna]